jgi:hypothetical protein
MKGTAVGPRNGVNASRAAQPATTTRRAQMHSEQTETDLQTGNKVKRQISRNGRAYAIVRSWRFRLKYRDFGLGTNILAQ